MKSTVVFSMISDIFFPAQLLNINFLSSKFLHIKSLDFILQFISLLSYNSLNLFTPLLILVHLLLIVGLQQGDIFADVGFSPGVHGSLLAAPAQQHIRHGERSDPQSISWRVGPIKNDSTTIKTQLHPESQHKRHKGHPMSIKFRRLRRLHH